MIAITCDKCRKTATQPKSMMKFKVFRYYTPEEMKNDPYYFSNIKELCDQDICKECQAKVIQDIQNFLDNYFKNKSL